jgi:hypothetical protein
MPCYHPITAYSKGKNKEGKRVLVFKEESGTTPIKINCSHCIGCRLEKGRQWAVRAYHEAQIEAEAGNPSCFLTLTYNDYHLPKGGTLLKKDLTNFIKRLRDRVGYEKIRHLSCGEYGDNGDRPHYHLLLFGFDFPDKIERPSRKSQFKYYTSELCDSLWSKGYHLISPLTYETAMYVARYVTKKVTGPAKGYATRIVQSCNFSTGELRLHHLRHYERYNPLTGHVWPVEEEYQVMSRGGQKKENNKRGIGYRWIEKYYRDVYPADEIIVNGFSQKSTDYYDKIVEQIDPEMIKEVKEKREKYTSENQEEYTRQRLEQKEKVKKARIERYRKRNLQSDYSGK